MRQRRAILLWLLLVLPIALAAMPRGTMAGAASPVTGFVELCSEGRSLLVALDAEGRPAHPGGGCDHCAICCTPALAGGESALAAMAVSAWLTVDAASDHALRLRHPALCAAPRGPPLTESA